MKITRRETLSGAAAFGAAASTGQIKANATTAKSNFDDFKNAQTLIIDSRYLDETTIGLLPIKTASAVIDIADQEDMMWRQFRTPIAKGQKIIGLTSWTDYVMARGYLEEQGKRLTVERRLDGLGKTTTGKQAPTLIAWVLR